MKRFVAVTITLLFININAWSFMFNSLEAKKNRTMIKTQLNSAFKSYKIISHKIEIYNKETKEAPAKNSFKLDFEKNSILSKATNGSIGDVIIKFSKNATPSLKNTTIRVIPKEKKKKIGRKEEITYDFDKIITLTDMSLKISGFSFKKKSVDYSISPQISGSDFGPTFTVNDPEDLITDTYEEAQQEIKQTQKEQQQAAQNQAKNNNNKNNSNGGNNSGSSSDDSLSTSSTINTGGGASS